VVIIFKFNDVINIVQLVLTIINFRL